MRRRIPRIAWMLAGATLLLGSCGAPREESGTGPAAGVPVEALERARAAASAMGSRLMGTLLDEMEKGGPVQAVRVCSEVAPTLAAEQSGDGLTIRRVSLRARNPADEPDDYERAVLEKWAAVWEEGPPPAESAEVVELDGRPVLRYMRPIAVMRPCLTCHGDPAEMSPELRAVLEERYPADRATGYREGDLRGAFSVTVEESGTF